jgi:hypothetical protein
VVGRAGGGDCWQAARPGRQQCRAGRACDGPRGGHGVVQVHCARGPDAPVGGLQPHAAAVGGGQPNGAAAVRACCRSHQPQDRPCQRHVALRYRPSWSSTGLRRGAASAQWASTYCCGTPQVQVCCSGPGWGGIHGYLSSLRGRCAALLRGCNALCCGCNALSCGCAMLRLCRAVLCSPSSSLCACE